MTGLNVETAKNAIRKHIEAVNNAFEYRASIEPKSTRKNKRASPKSPALAVETSGSTSRELTQRASEPGQATRISNDKLEWPSMASKSKPHGSSIENVLYFCGLEQVAIQAKFNEFDGRTYVCIGNDRPQEELNDPALVEVMRQMHKCGCIISKSAVHDALLALGGKRRFHPVREYLAGLKWDRTKRLDNLIPHYLNAENTPLNRAMGRAWMVAAVRRVRQPGVKFDPILTLRGEQGVGKSMFFRILGTPNDRNFFSDSMDIGASAKETIESMSGVWIAEFPELSKLSVRETEQVKRAASSQSDRARVAYARLAAVVQRQFVCGATVNQEFFLRDDTGNRRFWIAEVGKLREAELIADRDQLWAEAAYLEAEGEPHNIPDELWPAAGEIAEQHMKPNPVAEAVIRKLAELPERDVIVLPQDLAEAIGIADVTRQGGQVAQSMAVGVKRAGWTVKHGRVPGVKSRGSIRYYAAPAMNRSQLLYAYQGDQLQPVKGYEPL
jgi:Virulence-associated protein E-like domain